MIHTAVIMAGGTGERFWPLGRRSRPKQLLKLTDSGKSLIQESIERALTVFEAKNIYVITSSKLKPQISDDLTEFDGINIITEPEKRNTAPCIAFAVAYILNDTQLQADQLTMSVLTADHIIMPLTKFEADVRTCLKEIEKGTHLCTLGIVPTYPATGFGYIETGDSLNDGILKANRFVEKPDEETAERYLKSGDYFWNSGMFFWRIDRLIKELTDHYDSSEIAVQEMLESLNANDVSKLKEAFCSLEPISIDYALMEKSQQVVVKPSTFSWKDAGSLDILSELNSKDDNGNVAVSPEQWQILSIDSANNITYSLNGKSVALIGISDMIVIDTKDALLICPKSRAQDVKQVIALAQEKGITSIL